MKMLQNATIKASDIQTGLAYVDKENVFNDFQGLLRPCVC